MPKYNILTVEQTVFFKQREGGLHQLVVVTLECSEKAGDASLEVVIDEQTTRVPLAGIPAGKSSHELYLPDIRSEGEVRFQLLLAGHTPEGRTPAGRTSAGHIAAQKTVLWKPQRHWEVYLVHYSHHDFGYTDLPSRVLEEYDGFMDQVLEYCEKTKDWPETDAVFRYLCEQTWSVEHYIANRPQETVDRLIDYIKSGQVEVTALFGNQTLELCGHEELIRLLYSSFKLKKQYGIKVLSAEHNDIPGFPWGLASVLAGAGVKYFSPGVPSWYFGLGEDKVHPLWDEKEAFPIGFPGACWWEGPDGARVLLWLDLHGREFQPYDYEQAFEELPVRLRQLDEHDFPYDMVSYTLRGGHRDNAPPTIRYAYLVREWNRQWAYPRLINATNIMFLEKFERKWGHALKTLRGDVPGTDYSVGAMCTPKETAAHKNAHDWLLTAEKLASLASIAGHYPYPRSILEKAYRDAFYYDLHCWGPMHPGGPAGDSHLAEKGVFAYRAAALAHDVIVKASNRLVDEIALKAEAGAEKTYYLTVFNTLARKRTDVVQAGLLDCAASGTPMHWTTPAGEKEKPRYVSAKAEGRQLVVPPLALFEEPFELVDVESGHSLVYQLSALTDARAAKPWAAERFGLGKVDPRHLWTINFLAKDLPASGYRTYRVKPCKKGLEFPMGCDVSGDTESSNKIVVENRFYRLEVDRGNGAVTGLFDRELERELIDGEADHGFGHLIARYSENGHEEIIQVNEVAVQENGPVYTTIRMTGALSCCPRVVVEITLYHGLKRLDVNARVLKDATPLVEVYIAFPFQIDDPDYRLECSGSVIRPIEDQWPGSNTDYYAVQHWVDVFNRDLGVVWSPLDSPIVEVGGLWPGYVSAAHHAVPGPGYGHPFLKAGELTKSHLYSMVSYNNFRTNFSNVQPGEFVVRHAFSSHRGDWQKSRSWLFGWDAAHPPVSVWGIGPKPGSLPPSASFIEIDTPNVIDLTFKRAEDGDGYILRLFETEGRETDTKVSLPLVPFRHALEANLVEENLRTLSCSDRSVRITMKPFSVKTIRIRTPPLA